MNSKVNIIADDKGNAVRQSNSNPEFGHVRLVQTRVTFGNSGWVKKSNISTLLHGKLEDLQEMGLESMEFLPGKIVIKEQLEAFSQNDGDRDYKMAGDTAKAVSTFQTCVEQNPDHYNGFIQLGLIYASINDDIAIAYYNNALQIYPLSTEALYNMALYYQNTERIALADKTYDKIIETNPEYFIAYYNKAFLRLVYSTDYDSAIYFFDKTLDYDETYFEAFYNKGYAYELKGDNKNAAAGYKSALALKPDFTLAAKGLNRVQ